MASLSCEVLITWMGELSKFAVCIRCSDHAQRCFTICRNEDFRYLLPTTSLGLRQWERSRDVVVNENNVVVYDRDPICGVGCE